VNIWLRIPLRDYEGHMALPDVGQAAALADEFERLLRAHRPESVALLGCSGGNGLERVDAGVSRRIVAVDVNPGYLDVVRQRFAATLPGLAVVACDVASCGAVPFPRVDLAFAGLLLEYVPLSPALRFVRDALRPGGVFGCVVQLPCASVPEVTPSPYASLTALTPHMSLVDPGALTNTARESGLGLVSSRTLEMPNGKSLLALDYRAA
jgi:SAM-dependent methyltransferase